MSDNREFSAAWLEAHKVPFEPVERGEIFGLAHAMRVADALVWSLTHADDPGLAGVEPPRGVMLTGGPGTGKTLVARYIATRLAALDPDLPFYLVANDELSPERIRGIFATLDAAPRRSVVCLDELENWVEDRGDLSDEARAMRTSLLSALDGLCGGRQALALLTTNVTHRNFYAPLVRSGRIGTKIPFDLPDAAAAAALFRHRLARAPGAERLDWEFLGEIGSGTPPSELVGAVNQAITGARMAGRDLTIEDLAASLSAWGVEVPNGQREPSDQDMRHEWGHATVTSVLMPERPLTMMGFAHRGFAVTRFDSSTRPIVEHELFASLASTFAGRAAEELVGSAEMGVESDMDRAESILEMLRKNGRWPDLVVWAGYHDTQPPQVLARLGEVQMTHLRWAADTATRIVEANRAHAELFVARFHHRRMISGAEWRSFITEHPLVRPALDSPPGGPAFATEAPPVESLLHGRVSVGADDASTPGSRRFGRRMDGRAA